MRVKKLVQKDVRSMGTKVGKVLYDRNSSEHFSLYYMSFIAIKKIRRKITELKRCFGFLHTPTCEYKKTKETQQYEYDVNTIRSCKWYILLFVQSTSVVIVSEQQDYTRAISSYATSWRYIHSNIRCETRH